MAGNGIRKDIWKQFQETFKIPQIIEFYGSTEGNANLGKTCVWGKFEIVRT